MRVTHYPSEQWPKPGEKQAEWFFQLFDALDYLGSLLRRKAKRPR